MTCYLCGSEEATIEIPLHICYPQAFGKEKGTIKQTKQIHICEACQIK